MWAGLYARPVLFWVVNRKIKGAAVAGTLFPCHERSYFPKIV